MTEFISNNIDETRQWAQQFAKTLNAPCVVALHGNLGMGKSEIARTIIQTLQGKDTVVPSPTFTIVQAYNGISHFDLYRIEDVAELTEIGLGDAIENDITLIEWPEIAENMLPDNTIHVFIDEFGDGRKILVKNL
ncbi:MAG: tRNA (adenosine(37)-N6)-threonylcarbamoyltransferase complex ATPase subunit type 1 TsaE [Alphaproteobacteria bacterium]|nr:tRNA (adenosine(37)-N6)-threonylcarbamoyltransferase complex ATPase subunit type 1 TsaE [Alphaproteobacteria bacterium]